MDFFEHQDAARRKTGLLVCLFITAVVAMVLAVYALALVPYLNDQKKSGPVMLADCWVPELFVPVAGGMLLLIGTGSLYKTFSLRAGGSSVALQLGGRKVNPNTTDLNERVLLNVVEEMAIASGVPVPEVYLLDNEPGINAFAAGFTTDDAVVGVTRGCVENLSRDELQGVIAHEFSHILNSDMRLNLRLIAILHGILLLAIIGRILLRSAGRSRSRKKNAGGVVLFGLALMIIGYVGLFFGKLIKSAISRQREFLADASAVQFTRNPPGLAGALKRIGGLAQGSRIANVRAEEASHLFFSNALRSSWFALMSTHPPLEERIRRLDPSFDGRFPHTSKVRHTIEELQPAGASAGVSMLTSAAQAEESVRLSPEQFVAAVGTPSPQHVSYAVELLSSLPEPLRHEIHEPLGALAALCGLLVDKAPEVRKEQLKEIFDRLGPAAADETSRLLGWVRSLPPRARLPLVELALPALNDLSEEQAENLRQTVQRLIAADKRISLFEYAVQRLLVKHLVRQHGSPRPATRYRSLRPLLADVQRVLSLLAHLGRKSQDPQAAENAYAAGLAHLGLGDLRLPLLARKDCRLAATDEALDRLAMAYPQAKKQVLEACAACIGADGHVTVAEGELLRALADSLDCPVPPLDAPLLS